MDESKGKQQRQQIKSLFTTFCIGGKKRKCLNQFVFSNRQYATFLVARTRRAVTLIIVAFFNLFSLPVIQTERLAEHQFPSDNDIYSVTSPFIFRNLCFLMLVCILQQLRPHLAETGENLRK